MSGILSEEVGGISEEVGESAGAHVGFRSERVPYDRRIIYCMYSEGAGYFDVRSEQAFKACDYAMSDHYAMIFSS